ncbi:MAG: response regulator [Oscillospiraceae bacterium]|nr:response regulator [Oscillospiraceae bacterium]
MKVLIVDDNEITLEIEKLMLQGCGVEAEGVQSGKEAVELAKSKKYDMILMDIQMPEKDGFASSEEIRTFDKTTPIIAISADKIADTDERLIKSGINSCLYKPLEPEKIEELLNTREFTNEQSANKEEEKFIDDYEFFSFENLLSLVGDKETVFILLQQFLSSHGNDCDLMWRYIKEKDYLSAREVMHTLVGVVGTMYCTQLYEACIILGSEFRSECSHSFENFKNVWNSTIEDFLRCIKKLSNKQEK